VMARNSAAYNRGGQASTADFNWDAIFGQAESFLSQEQLAALKRVRSEKLINQQMIQLSQKLQQEAAKRGR
jgi:hypothetical protein